MKRTKSSFLGVFVLVLFSSSALGQQWPGQVVCSMLIDETGYFHEETQSWKITGSETCQGGPPSGTECYRYVWHTDGNGSNLTQGWTDNATGFSQFQRVPSQGGTFVQRGVGVPSSSLAGGNIDNGSSGATDEWDILRGTAAPNNIVLGASLIATGTSQTMVNSPNHKSLSSPVSCTYAFGVDGASRQFISATSKKAGTFEVFGLDPSDNTAIRRKSYAGEWGPGTSMQSAWGRTVAGPAGGFLESPPSAVALSPVEVHVLAIGTDGTAYHNVLRGCVPTCPSGGSWESLGRHAVGTSAGAGRFLGSIAAVSTGANQIELIAIGSDRKVYRKSYAGGTWTPARTDDWQPIGGKTGVIFRASPAASSWGADRLDVVASGSDGKVYHKFFQGAWLASGPGSQTGDWEPIGGLPAKVRILGSPTVVSSGQGRLDIFVRGTDNKVYHKSFGERGWTPVSLSADWESIGGPTGGAGIEGSPAAVSWGLNRVDIFVVGSDGNTYHKYIDRAWRQTKPGSRMVDWESLGGSGQQGVRAFVGTPAAVSWGADRLDIFAVSGSGKTYHKYFSGRTRLGPSGPIGPSWGPGSMTANWELIGN